MDITRFQTAACGDIRIALYPWNFSRTCSSLFERKIPFHKSLKAHHPLASVIFYLWYTWRKICFIVRFAIVDEFEHLSVHDDESCGPGCGGQWKTLISLTHIQKSSQSEHVWRCSRPVILSSFIPRAVRTHNLHVWEPKSVIIRHIAPIVFQSENIDFSECFGDRSSLRNCPDWSNSSIFGWKQYIHIIKSDPHREMDHLAQHSELRKDNRSPELSHVLSIHLAAYLPAPVRLNWHYLRKGLKSTFCSKLAKRWQNCHSGSSWKSARIELVFYVGLSHH